MVVEELFEEPGPQELFHYTSHDGLIGIIRNKELWATKAIFMNDAAEFKLALDLARTEIKSQSLPSDTREQLLADVDDIEHVNVFVASFSEHGDLLSQWRGYCSPGPGYSVGFRTMELTERDYLRFYLGKCVYDPFRQRAAIAEIVAHGANRRAQLGQPQPIRATLTHARDPLWGMTFRDLLAFVAPLLKHESFSEEAEWRLVSRPIPFTDPAFRHRAGRSLLIPYFRFSLASAENAVPLARVIIGPTPHPSLAEDAVHSLLGAAGVQGCTIEHSEIPFRNW